jgi:hypothetical protein
VWRAKRECQRNGVTVKAQVELALRCAFQSLDGGERAGKMRPPTPAPSHYALARQAPIFQLQNNSRALSFLLSPTPCAIVPVRPLGVFWLNVGSSSVPWSHLFYRCQFLDDRAERESACAMKPEFAARFELGGWQRQAD